MNYAKIYWSITGVKQFIIRFMSFLLASLIIMNFAMPLIAELLGGKATYKINGDYSIMFFSLLAILFFGKNMEKIAKLESYKNKIVETTLLSFISLNFFFIFFINYYFSKPTPLTIEKIVLYNQYYLLLANATLFTAIFNFEFINKLKKELTLTTLISGVFFILTLLLRKNWSFFSKIVLKHTVYALSIFEPVSINLSNFNIIFNGFNVNIGASCSGILSMSLFICLYLLFLSYQREVNKKNAIIYFFIGILGAFLVNEIRVVTLMLVGGYISKQLAITLFHELAGLILFLIYNIIFFSLVWKKVSGKKIIL